MAATISPALIRKGLPWSAVFVFASVLTWPNLLRVGGNGAMGNLEAVELPILALGFWLVWFAAFKRLWIGAAAATVVCAWWWPLELFLRREFGLPITPTSVGLALESDWRETGEFLVTYGKQLAPAFLVVLGVSAFTVWQCRLHQLEWTHRSRWWVLIVFPVLAWIAHSAFDVQDSSMDTEPPKDIFRVEPEGYWGDKWRDVFPVDLPMAVLRFREETQRVDGLRERVAHYDFHPKLTGAPAAEVLVVVIGESSRADRWSLAGYQRDTNPLLSRKQNLFFFGNTVTRSVATRTAVPSIVSRQPVLQATGEPNPSVEPSFLRALQQAGFRTHWISNQSSTGFFDTSVLFHAKDAEQLQFTNPASFSRRGSFDEALLLPLDRALNQAAGPIAIVLHTMGSHLAFENRYPTTFDRFQPSRKTAGETFKNGREEIEATSNTYDNTILYTDHVLSAVIDRVQATGRRAAVLYVSDHGQDVFDKGCLAPNTRATAYSYRVPALLWLSESLVSARPDLAEEARRKRHEKLVNDLVFPTVLDLAGIAVRPSASPSRAVSLFSKGGSVAREVAGLGDVWFDFDEAEGRNRCSISPPLNAPTRSSAR
jgi:glucan phosphoethanolaminetransferase (alkaline phosphatase superfamily)